MLTCKIYVYMATDSYPVVSTCDFGSNVQKKSTVMRCTLMKSD